MKHKQLYFGVIVAAAAICSAIGFTPTSAFAATVTWSGTSCASTGTSGNNCNWSNTANWVGGTIPANGDSVVIAADATNPASTNVGSGVDIASLSIADLTVTGYSTSSGGSSMYVISTSGGGGLTITGNIALNTPSVAAPSGYVADTELLLDKVIALSPNKDVTYTNIVTPRGEPLVLGGHAVTFTATGAQAAKTTYSIGALISGSGIVNYNLPTTQALFITQTNTYTGTTNINSVDYIDALGDTLQPFGTSAINLSSKARILFHPATGGAVTISNPISITPPSVTGTFLTNQLEFWDAIGGATVSYTVPNITLLGNARFGVNATPGNVKVNLTGITSNGHCIQYDNNNSEVASFTGGPVACTVAVAAGAGATTTSVKVPNTGIAPAVTLSNPLIIAGIGIVAAFALYIVTRKKHNS